jgi:hypothetical protein
MEPASAGAGNEPVCRTCQVQAAKGLHRRLSAEPAMPQRNILIVS